jgi:tetratricopeptide (TPR) repeat protein
MGTYGVSRGRVQELLPLVSFAADAISSTSRAGLAARAATRRTQAMFEYHGGDLAAAAAHTREALRWASRAGDTGVALSCLTVLGNALFFAGQVEAARAPFEQARRRAMERGDWAIAASAANGLGLVERSGGRYAQALLHFGQLLDLSARSGNADGQIVALINIGNVAMLQRDWPRARQTNEDALALARAARLDGKRAILHTVLAEVAIETGDLAAARRHADAAAEALRQSVDPVVATQLPLNRLRIELAEGNLPAAESSLAEAMTAARRLGSTTQQLSCLVAAGRVLAAVGQPGAQRLWWFVTTHPDTTASLQDAADTCLHALSAPPEPATELSGPLPALLDAVLARLPALALKRP